MQVLTIFERKEQQTRDAFEAYHQLRTAPRAKLDAMDPPQVDEILKAANKSWSDLQRDVSRYEVHCQRRRELDELDRDRARKSELVATIQERNAQFELIRQQHEQSLMPMQFEIAEIEQRLIFESDARKRFNESRFTDWDGELKTMADRINTLRMRNQATGRKLVSAKANLATGEAGGSKMRAQLQLPEPDVLRRYVENAEKEHDATTRELQAAVQKQNELITRINAQ